MTEKSPLFSIDETESTGIGGLDKILRGGYTIGRTTLFRGASGAGKTIFSLMFANQIAKSQPVVFASFDEPVEHLVAYLDHWKSGQNVTFIDFTPSPDIAVSGGDVIPPKNNRGFK